MQCALKKRCRDEEKRARKRRLVNGERARLGRAPTVLSHLSGAFDRLPKTREFVFIFSWRLPKTVEEAA